MKKERLNSWSKKIKTLPLKDPRFAFGLCSMIPLWLVVFPALTLAIKKVEFPLTKLILTVIGSLALATFIFYKMEAICPKNSKRYER